MTPILSKLISEAFAEDMPKGDVTTDALGIRERRGKAKLIAKEDLILAGREVFEAAVLFRDASAVHHWQFQDGQLVLKGQVVAWIEANLIELLKAERVALNFLGRLSGIATLTKCFVQECAGTRCKILDTRKTTPGLRELEKMAVRAGGGTNHRMDLSSGILVKDNHIRAAGSLREAIARVRTRAEGPIEVECRTLEEVSIAVEERVNRILLDNMSVSDVTESRSRIPSVIEVEVSGNMTVERVREMAKLDIDFISVGALTHSAPTADLSLMFEWPRPE